MEGDRRRPRPVIRDKRVKKIVIAGYSHGAALALLCHEYCMYNRRDIKTAVSGYGFGCPRVVFGILKKSVRERFEGFFVIRNKGDLVTHLPPVFFLFRHAGKLITIGDGRWNCIDAHRPENYTESLREYERVSRSLKRQVPAREQQRREADSAADWRTETAPAKEAFSAHSRAFTLCRISGNRPIARFPLPAYRVAEPAHWRRISLHVIAQDIGISNDVIAHLKTQRKLFLIQPDRCPRGRTRRDICPRQRGAPFRQFLFPHRLFRGARSCLPSPKPCGL